MSSYGGISRKHVARIAGISKNYCDAIIRGDAWRHLRPTAFFVETVEGLGPDTYCVRVTRARDGEVLFHELPGSQEVMGDIVQTVGLELSEKLGYRAGIDILE